MSYRLHLGWGGPNYRGLYRVLGGDLVREYYKFKTRAENKPDKLHQDRNCYRAGSLCQRVIVLHQCPTKEYFMKQVSGVEGPSGICFYWRFISDTGLSTHFRCD